MENIQRKAAVILVVEDNESHVELIRRALVPKGKQFNLAIAGTLAEARKKLAHASPDLLIVDYQLPDGKGIELLPGNPNQLSFPVVMMTGHGDEKIATAAMKAGAIDYIVKSDKTLADMPYVIERILQEWQRNIERKLAESRLAKTELRYLNLVASVSALPWTFDITNDRFTFFGKQIKSMLGVHSTTISRGKDWVKLIHPDDRKRTIAFCKEETKEGKNYEVEYRIKVADGSWKWVRNVISVEMEELGPVSLSGFLFDITKHKMVQETLQEEQFQTRQIIDTARDAFVSMDELGNITDWNPQAQEMFGWSREDALGRLMSKTIIPDEFRELHSKGLKHYLATGEGFVLNQQIEITALHRDGHTIPVELSIVSACSNGTMRFNAFIRDISERIHAKQALEKSREQLRMGLIGTVVAVSRAVGARDPYTAGHQQRVSQLSRAIAQEMELDAEQIEGLRLGATIHDIGKIYLPAEILSKPAKLTDIEFALVKSHSQVGYDILKDVSFPWPVADIAHQHHERLDGSGYPQGLKGDEICLEARIVAVADVVEAMASHRPYRPSLGIDVALNEIKSKRGKWFDPDAVDACVKLFRKKDFSFESS